MRRRFSLNALSAALLAHAVLAGGELAAQEAPPPADLALMGTIPIYWGEVDDMAGLLAADRPGHWARPVIEGNFRLHPLDYLSAEALRGHTRLLLAQPRGLAAEENVALDLWVREGGQLLLFADPLMTGHTRFALGDRRRPQDVVLLSPILAHWGLELHFDEAQPGERRVGDFVPQPVPVEMSGQFVLAHPGADCALSAGRILAECRLGAGKILAVADAALLDGPEPGSGSAEALTGLLTRIFGNPVPPPAQP